MDKYYSHSIITLVFALVMVAAPLMACAPEQAATPSPAAPIAAATSTVSVVEPTAITTETAAPPTAVPPTPEPTVAPPTAAPTMTPSPVANAAADLAVISPENAGQLTPLAQIGNGRIDSITWLADGATFAVGSSQGIDLYNSQTLQLSQTIRDEQIGGTIRTRFSPSGKFLIMTMGGGEMDRVTLWDATSGHYVRDLNDAFLNDFSPDDLIVYFEWATQQMVWQDPLTGENRRAISLPYIPHAFNLASQTAAELYQENSLRLYDLASGQLRHTLELPDIDDVAFSPGGELLATSSRDGFIRLWDVQSGTLLHKLEGQEGWIMEVVFSPNGRILAANSGEKTTRLWDTSSGQRLHEVFWQPGCSPPGIVAFSPDSQAFAIVSGNKVLFLNVADGTVQRTLDNDYCFASDLAFSPDSHALLVAGGDKVHTVDIPGGQLQQTQEADSAVASVAVSADGERMVWGGGDDATWLQLWDMTSDQPLYTVAEEGQPIHQVAFSPDGQLLAVQSGTWQSPLVQLRAASSGELLATYTANTFAFTPDGRFLATSITPYAPETAGINLWDISTFQLARRLELITLLAITPAGNLLVAEDQGRVSWWDMESGERLRPFSPTEGPTAAHSFSPDEGLFLGSGPYGSLDVWDVASSQGVWSQYLGQTGAFSPDGRYLATISGDGIVWLWGVPGNH